MNLPGAEFFYALAGLSMAFVAFSAIVITLRQGTGKPLTPQQVLTTRQYIEMGFMATGFAMLPPLLALCSLPVDMVWRASSAIIIAIRAPYYVVNPLRRRAVAPDEKIPLRYYVNGAVIGLILVALFLNVIGVPFAPGPGPVAVAASHTLFVAAAVFLATFTTFLKA